MIIERSVLVQGDVEFRTKTVRPLQCHDIRVVGIAHLVIRRNAGGGLNEQTGIAHAVRWAGLQLCFQRSQIIPDRRIGREVQYDRATAIEAGIGRLRNGDSCRCVPGSDVQEDRLISWCIMIIRHIRRRHPEFGARLCHEAAREESPKKQEKCLFHCSGRQTMSSSLRPVLRGHYSKGSGTVRSMDEMHR